MKTIGHWVGAVVLWYVAIGGAAICIAADGGSPASNDDAPEISSSSDSDTLGAIRDAQVEAASASSVIEDAGDCWDSDLLSRCCRCNQSAWILSGGALFLHRSRPDPTTILAPSSGPGALMTGSNFGFNWNSGPLLSIARRTSCGLIFEGRYFNDRDATANYELNNVTTFRAAGIGVTILGGGSIWGTYRTQLDSTEFNMLAPLGDRVSLIGGFRAVQLHDQLNLTIASPGIITNWNENNRLYGAQTGINLNLFQPGRALQFNGSLKAGLFSNGATNIFTSSLVSGARSSGSANAFVGELNFTASYRITQRWSVTGGYMVLWLDGLALADRAAAHTTQVAGGSSSPVNLHGDLWYNGALVSLNYVW
ncbi:MAG TPA: hypothetical protein VMF30_14615 [Pirellulales bacterium]|nr:hypothetical protein [Pirellulales bacterium]